MLHSAEAHDAAGKLLLESGNNEITIATQDPETGVLVKCRPDKLTGSGIIIDWKSTNDASPQGFAKSVASYGYHRQAAFYLDCCKHAGVEVKKFVFVAVQKKPPYLVGVYELDEAAINLGREINQRALSEFAICQHEDIWPAYSPEIQTLSLPNWLYNAEKRGNDEY